MLFYDAQREAVPTRGRRALSSEEIDAIVEAYAAFRRNGHDRLKCEDLRVVAAVVGIDKIRARRYSLSPIDYRTFDGREDFPVDPVDLDELDERLAESRREAAVAEKWAVSPSLLTKGRNDGLPGSWLSVPLAEICSIQAGPSHAQLGRSRQSEECRVPLVLPKHLKNGVISDEATENRVPSRLAWELERFTLEDGDILCVRTGSTGPSALVTAGQTGWLFNTNLLRLRPREYRRCDPRYLRFYLSSPRIVAWLKDRSSATAVPTLAGEVLGDLLVMLPPLDEQQRIADALQSLEAQASAYQAMTLVATELFQAAMNHLVGGELLLPRFRPSDRYLEGTLRD